MSPHLSTAISVVLDSTFVSGWLAYLGLRHRVRRERDVEAEAAAERAIRRLGGWEVDGLKLPDPTDTRWIVEHVTMADASERPMLSISLVRVDVKLMLLYIGDGIPPLATPSSKEYGAAVVHEYRQRLAIKAISK
jgi:hypothetical protein